MKENFFYEKGIVHDNSSPERCNFSEKKMIYKVLQDHVLQDLGLTPRNLKDATEVKNVPYKEQDIWKKIFFMKMVLYMTMAHLKGLIFLKRKWSIKCYKTMCYKTWGWHHVIWKMQLRWKMFPTRNRIYERKNFFMKMVLYMTMAHLKGLIFLKRKWSIKCYKTWGWHHVIWKMQLRWKMFPTRNKIYERKFFLWKWYCTWQWLTWKVQFFWKEIIYKVL